MSEQRRYTCPWCGRPSDASAGTTCPACGAAVDVRLAVDDGGWTQLPPIRDMARLQFGRSTCQVEGTVVPVADVTLAAGDGIYFAHHLLLWKEDAPTIARLPMGGWWRRLVGGLPLVLTGATGPGRLAFSKDAAGEIVAVPLSPGQAVDCREKAFMLATAAVAYDWVRTGIWFSMRAGNNMETIHPIGQYLDRFAVPLGGPPGLLLLHGSGGVLARTLAPGQSILVQPSALLFKAPSVQMNLHFEHPGGTWRSWRSWGDRYLWLRLTGPGRVAIESRFRRVEDPGSSLSSSAAGTTSARW